MKLLIVIFTAMALTPAAHARGPLYQRSIDTADLMYLYEANLNSYQASKVAQLFDEIEKTVKNPNFEMCGDRNQVFRTVFEWARSFDGAHLDRGQAQILARELSEEHCPTKYFQAFKSTFDWARSFEGVNLDRERSVVEAKIVAGYEQQHHFKTNVISCVKSQFEFARSFDGLNLDRVGAKKFAYDRCLTAFDLQNLTP